MTTKLLILTNGEKLISQLVEVAPIDIGDPNCKLIEPFIINADGTLTPWLVNITNDNEFMMSSDKILTLADPTPTLLEKYQDLIDE